MFLACCRSTSAVDLKNFEPSLGSSRKKDNRNGAFPSSAEKQQQQQQKQKKQQTSSSHRDLTHTSPSDGESSTDSGHHNPNNNTKNARGGSASCGFVHGEAWELALQESSTALPMTTTTPEVVPPPPSAAPPMNQPEHLYTHKLDRPKPVSDIQELEQLASPDQSPNSYARRVSFEDSPDMSPLLSPKKSMLVEDEDELEEEKKQEEQEIEHDQAETEDDEQLRLLRKVHLQLKKFLERQDELSEEGSHEYAMPTTTTTADRKETRQPPKPEDPPFKHVKVRYINQLMVPSVSGDSSGVQSPHHTASSTPMATLELDVKLQDQVGFVPEVEEELELPFQPEIKTADQVEPQVTTQPEIPYETKPEHEIPYEPETTPETEVYDSVQEEIKETQVDPEPETDVREHIEAEPEAKDDQEREEEQEATLEVVTESKPELQEAQVQTEPEIQEAQVQTEPERNQDETESIADNAEMQEGSKHRRRSTQGHIRITAATLVLPAPAATTHMASGPLPLTNQRPLPLTGGFKDCSHLSPQDIQAYEAWYKHGLLKWRPAPLHGSKPEPTPDGLPYKADCQVDSIEDMPTRSATWSSSGSASSTIASSLSSTSGPKEGLPLSAPTALPLSIETPAKRLSVNDSRGKPPPLCGLFDVAPRKTTRARNAPIISMFGTPSNQLKKRPTSLEPPGSPTVKSRVKYYQNYVNAYKNYLGDRQSPSAKSVRSQALQQLEQSKQTTNLLSEWQQQSKQVSATPFPSPVRAKRMLQQQQSVQPQG